MKSGNLKEIPEEDNSHSALIRKRVILRKGEVPHIMQWAQSRFPDGTNLVEEHSHESIYEIFMVDEGEAQININGVPYNVKKGSYIVVNPGEVHSITNTRGFVSSYFSIAE